MVYYNVAIEVVADGRTLQLNAHIDLTACCVDGTKQEVHWRSTKVNWRWKIAGL